VVVTGAGRLREWALVSGWWVTRDFSIELGIMLMVTNSIAAIIFNSFSLPIKEEVCICKTNHYSKFDQKVNAYIKVLTEWLLMRT